MYIVLLILAIFKEGGPLAGVYFGIKLIFCCFYNLVFFFTIFLLFLLNIRLSFIILIVNFSISRTLKCRISQNHNYFIFLYFLLYILTLATATLLFFLCFRLNGLLFYILKPFCILFDQNIRFLKNQ